MIKDNRGSKCIQYTDEDDSKYVLKVIDERNIAFEVSYKQPTNWDS